MTPFARIGTIRVPRRCIDGVQAHLRKVGLDGHEGLGLLVGVREGDRFSVHRALIPAQKHVRTSDGVCVIVGADELHRINVWLYRNGMTLMAQVHSHPGRAYHSTTDDEFAVATAAGCLSLVVPDFAARHFDLGAVAAYRLDAKGRWREIRRSEIARLIEIVD